MINSYIKLLTTWRKEHPGYAPQLCKIQKTLEKMNIEYMSLNRQYQIHKKPHILVKADEIEQEATQLIKKLERYELIATLSKN